MADYEFIPTDPGATGSTVPIALHDIAGEKAQVVVIDIGDGLGKDPLGKGQKNGASSLSIVPASDATFPISQAKSATATPATPAMAQAASATIMAANANRLGLVILNTRTVDLLINIGAAASATAFVARIAPQQEWTMSRDLGLVYTGTINGILADTGNDGNVYVQELTI
jgi:hypothetical protein